MKINLSDVLNLIVSKGGNFTLTTFVFFVAGRGMSADDFSEFGYWWSIAIMFGGLLFGGVAIALVRIFIKSGTLLHIVAPFVQFLTLAFSIILCVALLWVYFSSNLNSLLLFLVLIFFGILVQIQTVIFTFLRVLNASRVNGLSTIGGVLIISAIMLILMDVSHDIIFIFSALCGAYFAGIVLVTLIARKELNSIFLQNNSVSLNFKGFIAGASAFTVINAFSYIVVNIDFTISHQILKESVHFTNIGTAKIYYERFLLPLLLIIAGAASMRLLRDQSNSSVFTINWRRLPLILGVGVLVMLLMVAGYAVFIWIIRGECSAIDLYMATFASLGYLLMAVNGVFLDMLALRFNLRTVAVYTFSFIIVGACVQLFAISYFNAIGWSVGWLIFNILVHLSLLSKLRGASV